MIQAMTVGHEGSLSTGHANTPRDALTRLDALRLVKLGGSPTDGKSMIWPMKVFRGSQPYDPVNKTLVTPHTAGNDDTGYWKNLDWDKAVATGMKDSGAPWSGKVDFIKTEMSWPITHMVQPASDALQCAECHSDNGRLDWNALGYPGDPMEWGGR